MKTIYRFVTIFFLFGSFIEISHAQCIVHKQHTNQKENQIIITCNKVVRHIQYDFFFDPVRASHLTCKGPSDDCLQTIKQIVGKQLYVTWKKENQYEEYDKNPIKGTMTCDRKPLTTLTKNKTQGIVIGYDLRTCVLTVIKEERNMNRNVFSFVWAIVHIVLLLCHCGMILDDTYRVMLPHAFYVTVGLLLVGFLLPFLSVSYMYIVYVCISIFHIWYSMKKQSIITHPNNQHYLPLQEM